MKLSDFLFTAADAYGPRTAVTHGDRSISYAHLADNVRKLADYLVGREIGTGARVGILIENSIEYAIAYFGALAAGCVAVPLDTSQHADKLRYMIADSGAVALLTQTRFARHLPKIAAAPTTLELIVTDSPLVNLPLQPATASFEEILGQGEEVSGATGVNDDDDFATYFNSLKKQASAAPHELAAIFYTSGSTGTPKGVMLSHRNLISNTIGTIEYLRLKPSESVIVILPFYYIYGNSLLLTHIACGGRVVIDNRFTYPEAVLDTMEKEQVSGFSGVPSNFMILLDNSTFGKRDLPSLRYFTQAGGAMAPEVIRRLMAAFPKKEIFIMYGQTEASPRVSWLPPERLADKVGSIGIPVPGVLVRVVDKHGHDTAPGVEGEIIVGGDSVMMGYWNQPDEQAEVLRDGWLYTGDLAKVDDDGYMFIVGRKKEIIKVGGNRVSAKEVEETILQHPDIAEIAILGIPDPVLGEAILAVAVRRDGTDLDAKHLQNFCKARLAVHKIPKVVRFIDQLPKYKSGKVNKPALRKMAR